MPSSASETRHPQQQNKSKHLLLLLPGYQLFGQEQSLLTVARSLHECGVDVHFLLHSQWGREIAAELDRSNFAWTMLPLGSLWSVRLSAQNPLLPFNNLLAVVRTSLRFLSLIKRQSFTHLLVGNATFGSYLLPALWFSSLPVIYRHGDDAASHSFFHRLLQQLLFRRSNLHVTNCQYLKRRLREQYPFVEAQVIHNAPRESRQPLTPDVRSSRAGTEGGVRLIFVGQLSPHKGVLLLLQAFRLLAPRYPLLGLDLAGEVPGVGDCQPTGVAEAVQRAVQEFPGRVVHHGFVKEPAALCSTAQIHVCPSIWQEPSPNVVLEAKQNHLPSVVFDVGGLPELVTHQVDGYICSGRSAEALMNGIEYFLADEERRTRAGTAAFQSIADRFSRERLQREWLAILEQV